MLTFHHADYADAFAQETGLVGWSQHYAQLGAGPYSGSIDTLALPGITIYRERIGVPVLQEVAGPAGRTTFSVTLSPEGSWRVEADAVFPGALRIVPGEAEGIVVGTAPSDVVMVSVDSEALAGQMNAPALDGPCALAPCCAVWDLAHWLGALLERHARVQPGTATLEEATVKDLLLDRLAALADAAQGHPAAAISAPSSALYRRTRDFLASTEGEPLTVTRIARELDVAPAALRGVFARVVGVSPGEWIRLRRLDTVRRDLCRAADTGRTVSDIAMASGFWHLGRFSRTYADHFGETPSETVQRHRLT